MNRFRLLVLLPLLALLPLRAAVCPESACVGISSDIVTVDGTTGALLNGTLNTLLGTTAALTPLQWQAINDSEVNVGDLLLNLTGSSDTEAALATSVTPAGLVDALAGTLLAQGDVEAAAAVEALNVDAASGTITLGSVIDSDDPSALSIGSLDLITASSQQYNYDNVSLPVPTVVEGSALGLGDVLNNVTITALVEEPPTITCGPEGTAFRSAGLRLKVGVDLVDQQLTGTLLDALGPILGTLPLGTSIDQATLTNLELYVTVGRADGVIEVIDPDNNYVKVRARPGLADVYLGSIDDSYFFDRNSLIDANSFSPTEIGELELTLLGIPVTAAIEARAVASGQDSGYTILEYFGPYPETQTAGVGAVAVDNIVDSLTDSLEISVTSKSPAVLSAATQLLFDQVLATILPTVNSVYNSALSPVLRPVLSGVVDPLLEGLGVELGEADVTVYSVNQNCGYSLSGTVYRDDNRSGVRDDGEAGTGLTWYAKLVEAAAPGGPALQAVAVDPASGRYTFPNVALGEYHIVIDDNAVLGDVTPGVPPAGWTGTEQPTLRREQVVMLDADVDGFDFGLAAGVSVAGVVFVDNGAGGGTANDGARNGGETGQAGVTVILEDAGSGTELARTATGGDGSYSLFVDGGVAAGTALRVRAVDATGFVTTGGSVGDSGGSYDQGTDAITFTHDPALNRSGLNFGDVPLSRLTTEGRQTAQAGAVVYYPHTFEAGTAGSVEFNVTTRATPADSGWSAVLYRDLNGDGQAGAGEPQVSGPIDVTADEQVDLVLKVFVPDGAPFGARHQAVVSATLAATNQPTLTFAPPSRTDVTEVGEAGANGLTLFKEVDKDQARPGDTLTYTIRYRNLSSTPIRELVIRDMTPAFTTLAAAPAPVPAAGLTGADVVSPGVGGRGALTWTFAGELQPGAEGVVSFSVRLDD